MIKYTMQCFEISGKATVSRDYKRTLREKKNRRKRRVDPIPKVMKKIRRNYEKWQDKKTEEWLENSGGSLEQQLKDG